MFENRNQPLVSRRRFAFRVAICLGIAVAIDATALGTGAIGFHALEGMDWLLACVNAAMVITGNGMVSQLHTAAGRLFSIFDVLFGVLAFISVIGVILAPVFHRILHTFHLEVPNKPERS
jgi:hypothetical protein